MNIVSLYDKFTRKEILVPQNETITLKTGDFAVYLDDEGKEHMGRVHFTDRKMKNKSKVLTHYSLLRKATAHDIQRMDVLNNKAEEAMEICRKKVKEHKLNMQLVFTEFSLDGNKINFIFTSDDRVDFRALVKDLASTFQKQIHLQQIGPRDKAKIITGRGKCGKRLCCSCWLNDLQSITMDMVRAQCLESKGSSKLSGCCGKLLCCLRYEVEEYKELEKSLPKIGSRVKLKKGEAEVTALDVLNQKIKVVYSDRSTETVTMEDVKKVLEQKESEKMRDKKSDPILKEA